MRKSIVIWSLGLLVFGAPALAVGAEGAAGLQRLSGEMERLSTAIGPMVVQVTVHGLKIGGHGDSQAAGLLVDEHSRGSGFFVTADGYLLTNAHVVVNGVRFTVQVEADAPREYPARLIATDSDHDLALLKIDATGMPFFSLEHTAAPRQGQLVLAFGSPLGLAQSATLGLISAVDRNLDPDDPREYIQTDAPLNPGNSGGPLVDLEGHLLGINTMIYSQSGGSEGIGFAVPLEVIRHSYAGMRANGTLSRPLLGIQPRSLTPELARGLNLQASQGVLVEDVAPSGPGADAGVLPGDVIVSLDKQPIRNLRDLFDVEYRLSGGVPVFLVVLRGSLSREFLIAPVSHRGTSPLLNAKSITEKENLIFSLGIFGATLTEAMAANLDGVREARGVLVVARAGVGMAGQNVLEPGDIVHGVNGRAIDGIVALRLALEAVPEGAPLILQIERGGRLSYVSAGGTASLGGQPSVTVYPTVWKASGPANPCIRF